MDNNRTLNNEYGLAEIQDKLLQTLDRFDLICRENNIKYSLHGGTLLGAERNHHLIPWDDDGDVSMTRNEYEKFKKILQQSKRKDVVVIEDDLWVPRLICAMEDNPAPVDIFVYDYISEYKLASFCKITLLRFLQGMIKTSSNNKNVIHSILSAISHIVGALFSFDTKIKMYQNVETKWFLGKKKRIHRSNDSFYGLPYIFDSEFMSEYADIELEGRKFMVNLRYKEFLRRNYGDDYLTPPPEKDRVPEHIMIQGN